MSGKSGINRWTQIEQEYPYKNNFESRYTNTSARKTDESTSRNELRSPVRPYRLVPGKRLTATPLPRYP